jgi:hypothetical protein
LFLRNNRPAQERHFQGKWNHRFAPDSAVFDDDNLVSCAGLVPVMTLAEQTGLSDLLAAKVRIVESRITFGGGQSRPETGDPDRRCAAVE